MKNTTTDMTPRAVTWVGILTNVVLALLKTVIGVWMRSQTLLADGLHSISDLLTDAAVLAGLRVSSKPADDDHHYGHRRVTTLVTMFVGAALLVTAAWIVIGAVTTYRDPHPAHTTSLPFWVALVSILPKELLYRLTRRVGLASGDASVIANAWHHRTDAFTSIAAAVGLAGVAFGGPDWAFLDHITAVVLSAFLAVAAVRFIAESVAELIDAAPRRGVVACIEEAINKTPGVLDSHALRVRKLGGALTLDVHIDVDPRLSVVEGHDIATAANSRVLSCGCDVIEAVVHVEPAVSAEPGSKTASGSEENGPRKASDFSTVVNCMDGRVQLPVMDYMRERFGTSYVDSVTEAGPVRAFGDDGDESMSLAIRARIGVSLRRHGSRVVAVVAHEDCGGNPVARGVQLSQLGNAVRSISRDFPNVLVVGLWVDDSWHVREELRAGDSVS